jgi:putative tricarboxylic transport membrane protein
MNLMRVFLAVCAAAAFSFPAHAQVDQLTIMAPAAPGGGWDQTARSMQQALTEAGLASNVQVTNVPGAGGTIGIAQFVNNSKGDPKNLIVGGYVMVGAIIANKSPVTLADVTPIARLTVSTRSLSPPPRTSEPRRLVAKLKGRRISKLGGRFGQASITSWSAKSHRPLASTPPDQLHSYSGGGEALAAILGGG